MERIGQIIVLLDKVTGQIISQCPEAKHDSRSQKLPD